MAATTPAIRLEGPLAGENLYGRASIPGVRGMVTARVIRKSTHADLHFYHRVKNGVFDPLTFYHLLDAVMRIQPGQIFRTADLLPYLAECKPQLVWDAITVGRVLNDIALALAEAYGVSPITVARRWNGNCYEVQGAAEFRSMLHRLLEDLRELGEEVLATERQGRFEKRITSPIERCTSVMDPLGAVE